MSMEYESHRGEIQAKLLAARIKALHNIGQMVSNAATQKLASDYLNVITNKTRQTTGFRMSSDSSAVFIGTGTWYGAAYNVKGGWNTYKSYATSKVYYEKYKVQIKESKKNPARGASGAYRPFLLDSINENMDRIKAEIKTTLGDMK